MNPQALNNTDANLPDCGDDDGLSTAAGCHGNESETDDTKKLTVEYTAHYRLARDDRGSGGNHDVSVYKPIPDSDSEVVGTVAVKGYNSPNEPVIVFVYSTSTDVARKAEDFELIYKDSGTGAYKDGSVWRPTCPDGYFSVSDFAQSGYTWPGVLYESVKIRPCIVKSCLTQCEAEWIWDDKGTGGDQDVVFYRVWGGVDRYGSDVGHSGGFFRAISQYNTAPKKDLLQCIKSECVEEF